VKYISTYTKILIALAFSAGIFVVLILLSAQKSKEQLKQEEEIYCTEFENSIKSIVGLMNSNVDKVIVDYTYWTEFIQNIYPYNEPWFKDNINTTLTSFHHDFVAVYDSIGNLVHQITKENLVHPSIDPLAIEQILKHRFGNFYIKNGQNFYYISGGTIHTDDDPQHKTSPKGVFVIGKIIGREMRTQMENITRSNITIDEDTLKTKVQAQKLFAFIPMKSWDNQVFGYITFSRDFHFFKIQKRQDAESLLLIIVSAIVSLLIFFITFKVWVQHPLSLITDILQNEGSAKLERLKSQKSEFGEIGHVMDRFIQQKQELVIAKEKAEESEKLKTAFLSNMSHEIRTPLNGILGFSRLLVEEELTPELRTEFVKIIETNGDQLLTHLNNVMDLAKMDAGILTLENRACSIFNIVNELYLHYSTNIKVISGAIRFEVKPGLSEQDSQIISEPDRIMQILKHLIENAFKYTEKGTIEFGYNIHEHYQLLFYIKDSGIGIPKKKQEMVFDNFMQGDMSIRRKYSGSGLGLSLAKSLVELMKGKIWLSSELHKGTTVYFSIPYIKINVDAEL